MRSLNLGLGFVFLLLGLYIGCCIFFILQIQLVVLQLLYIMQIVCFVVLFLVCYLYVLNNNCIIYLIILFCVEDGCGLGRYIWDICMYIVLQKVDVISKLYGFFDFDDFNSYRLLL